MGELCGDYDDNNIVKTVINNFGYTKLVQKVAKSEDFIMCSCELVTGLTEDRLAETKDPAIIDFYSFLFHHQTWTVTSITDWPDTFDVRGNTTIVFVW